MAQEVPENFPQQRLESSENPQEQATTTPVKSPDESAALTDINSGSSPASPRKVEANQHNAGLSSGPKTPEGKKASSRNARKHGLLVKDVVIKDGAGQEDEAEFEALLAALRDEYQPERIAEDLLVREIAISYWFGYCEAKAGSVTSMQKRWNSGTPKNHYRLTALCK